MKIISFLEKKHIFQGVQFDVQISVISPRRGNHIEIQHKLWRWIFSDNDNVITTTKKTMPMKKYMCIASFSAAILFAAVGMAIPPQGVIDGSVLILAAQLFVLCATFLGIKDLSLPKKG